MSDPGQSSWTRSTLTSGLTISSTDRSSKLMSQPRPGTRSVQCLDAAYVGVIGAAGSMVGFEEIADTAVGIAVGHASTLRAAGCRKTASRTARVA